MDRQRILEWFQSARGRMPGTTRAVTALRMYQAQEALQLMGLGTLIGILAGLAGVSLNTAVHSFEHWRHTLHNPALIILFPAVGALIGITLQRTVFRDYTSHGVPDVIESVTTGQGNLPRRLLGSRLVSSFFTVGSGGSAGLEGPIVVSGAAIGSMVARWFDMPQRRRVLLIACGSSGAIAGIFNAPLTGLIFALEVILGEWKARNLVPTITSAAVATQVSRLLIGDKIPFPKGETFFHGAPDLPAFVLLGIVCAYMGWLLVKALRISEKTFAKLHLPVPVKAGLGGLGVGLLSYFLPGSGGEGYGLIDSFITGTYEDPLHMIALLIVLRLITTALTLGSGGSGGVFAPSLFFGSAIGLIFGQVLRNVDPTQAFAEPQAYALAGMAGLVAAIMSAPLTGIFIILEMTGSYDLILPLMLCALTASLAFRYLQEGSIYTMELIGAGAFRRRGTDLQILADMALNEVMQLCIQVPQNTVMADFIQEHGQEPDVYYALQDEQGRYAGLVFLNDLRPYFFDSTLHGILTLSAVADRDVPELGHNATPDMAWIAFGRTTRDALPVLDGQGKLLGLVTKASLFDSSRREVLVHEES